MVIVDADTTIDPDLLADVRPGAARGHDWIQAYYTVANPEQSWRTRLMTYAFSLYQRRDAAGPKRLGLVVRGSRAMGCAFRRRGLRRRPWRSYGLVEDMEYSWTLRVAGEKILFLPEASVCGAMLGAGRRGRGRSTAAVGVRPARDPQKIPGPAAAIA